MTKEDLLGRAQNLSLEDSLPQIEKGLELGNLVSENHDSLLGKFETLLSKDLRDLDVMISEYFSLLDPKELEAKVSEDLPFKLEKRERGLSDVSDMDVYGFKTNGNTAVQQPSSNENLDQKFHVKIAANNDVLYDDHVEVEDISIRDASFTESKSSLADFNQVKQGPSIPSIFL